MPVILQIKVVPQAGRRALVWDEKHAILRAYLKSAPEKNKANNELIALLRKTLGLPMGVVTIVGGATTRVKRIRIDTELSREAILAQCGVRGVQQSVW